MPSPRSQTATDGDDDRPSFSVFSRDSEPAEVTPLFFRTDTAVARELGRTSFEITAFRDRCMQIETTMARRLVTLLLLLSTALTTASPSSRQTRQTGPQTCPGFAGFCSESYPGDTCLVVCAFGRPNVPECQTDGTWTDAPRCIEHEPGIPEQIPGICPGIPGYCSLAHSGALCEFDCLAGQDIRSTCTADGTWAPYPTCDGDIRETKDGCDPCPGEFGGARDRKNEQGGGSSSIAHPPQPAPPAQQAQPARPPPPPQQHQKQPSQPAQPARQQQKQGPTHQQQQARPATVIQPVKQTGFSPAPLPLDVPQNNNKQPSNNNFKQPPNNFKHQQQLQQQHQAVAPAPPQTPVAFNPPRNNNNNQIPQSSQSKGDHKCPGDALEACIDVCPSFSARIFGACVAGCARRCPNKK